MIVVVSAAPGDGKSTTSRNLALAAAAVGERVLFLEADFRRPTAASAFGVARGPGVVDMLTGAASLEQVVQTVQLAAYGEGSLDVMVTGAVLPPNPARITESDAMRDLLLRVASEYDLVVVDTPPLAVVSDAFPILRVADGVLVVSRLRRNRRDVAARVSATLRASEAPTIGIVANGVRGRTSGGYSYSYEYEARAPEPSPNEPASVAPAASVASPSPSGNGAGAPPAPSEPAVPAAAPANSAPSEPTVSSAPAASEPPAPSWGPKRRGRGGRRGENDR